MTRRDDREDRRLHCLEAACAMEELARYCREALCCAQTGWPDALSGQVARMLVLLERGARAMVRLASSEARRAGYPVLPPGWREVGTE